MHENSNQHSIATVVNDFLIPSRSSANTEQHRGQHFQIWFLPEPQTWGVDQNAEGYYIKDLGIGFGVFKKMDTLYINN